MNSLQIQITELEEKIDSLRKLVERIGEQVNILVKEKSYSPASNSNVMVVLLAPSVISGSSILSEKLALRFTSPIAEHVAGICDFI